MSNTTEDRPNRQGNRRSGNRNNNNRRGQGRGNSNSSGSSRRESTRPPVPRAEAPPLSLWQKILKAIGLYKAPEPPRGRRPQKQFDEPRQPRKSNTRNAKGRSPREPRPAPDPDKVSGTRLYLGNLSFDATESDLEELFKGVGPVRNIDIVYNRSTHRSKGYGFIEMSRLEDAKRAVEVLHDQPFMGRQLIVNEAKSKGPADASLDSGDDGNDD